MSDLPGSSIHHPPSTINDSTISHPPSTIAFCATGPQQSELLLSPVFQMHELIFAEGIEALAGLNADAYFDLLFEEEIYRKKENGMRSGKWKETGEVNSASDRMEENVSGSDQVGENAAGSDQVGENAAGSDQVGENAAGSDELEENAAGSDELEEMPGLHSANFPVPSEVLKKRIGSLSGLLPAPVFINSVIHPLSLLHPDFIRINGWPGFLQMPLLEAAAGKNSEAKARAVFGDQIQIVKDVPGFVTPRILSMIINEAYFTLHSGVSTRNEIDIAMKLGTGYPLGPFEWAEKIGIRRVAALLTALRGAEGEVYGLAPGIGEGGW